MRTFHEPSGTRTRCQKGKSEIQVYSVGLRNAHPRSADRRPKAKNHKKRKKKKKAKSETRRTAEDSRQKGTPTRPLLLASSPPPPSCSPCCSMPAVLSSPSVASLAAAGDPAQNAYSLPPAPRGPRAPDIAPSPSVLAAAGPLDATMSSSLSTQFASASPLLERVYPPPLGYAPATGQQGSWQHASPSTANLGYHPAPPSNAHSWRPMQQIPGNPYPAPSPPQLTHKVWILDCKSCDTFLTNRGMKVSRAWPFFSCFSPRDPRLSPSPF